MAAGEVLLNGAQLDDGGTTSHATAPNVLDGNSLTYWHTDPQANTGYVGIDAGASCSLTRVRLSAFGGSEDALVGGLVQGGSSSAFAQQLGFQQANGVGVNATNQTSVPVIFTGVQTAGNANIIFIFSSASAVISGVTDTKGNVYTFLYRDNVASGAHVSCYIATGIVAALANANTVTVSLSTASDYPTVFISEYSGISGTGLATINAHSSNSGTGTAIDSGNITTTNPNTVLVSIGGFGDSPAVSTGPGFILNKNLSPWGAVMEERPVISTVTSSGSFTISTSQSWNCTVAAFNLTGVYDPNAFLFVAARPLTGTLLNEYSITAAPLFRYYRYSAPSASNGNLADLDLIVQYTAGVTAAAVSPTILPTGRSFDLPTVITLSSITTDAAIYYTLDGTTPTVGSILYNAPFVLSASATLKAIAVSPGLTNSRVTSTKFNIPSSLVSLNSQIDDRNYKTWAVDPFFFLDPNSGWWYMYGINLDCNGIATFGYLGVDTYKSADLRNWIFVNTVIGPSLGTQVNSSTYFARPWVAYNASTARYVLWINSASRPTVYTAPSPEGPWTFVAQYTSLNGWISNGDPCWFLDSDGISAYLVFTSNFNAVFNKLTAAWTNVDGVNFASYDVASTFGEQGGSGDGTKLDGPHMFKRGNTYFFMSNAQWNWAPMVNCYATSSNPLGPWTNKGNPFQAVQGGNPDNSVAFGAQNNYPIFIPGRNAFIYTGDAYNTGLPGTVSTSTTANFQACTLFYLPIIFPTASTMSIAWNPSWALDNVFPTLSGAPVAPNNLKLSTLGSVTAGIKISWNNSEPNPHALYVDRSSDMLWTIGVRSYSVPFGATSFTDTFAVPGQKYIYRVRAVNANGTANSPDVTSGGTLVTFRPSKARRLYNLELLKDEMTKDEYAKREASILNER